MVRAVFLDRDGVLSVPEFRGGRSYAPRRFADFRLCDDAAESVARLRAAGFRVIVVTNQPDVGAGLLAAEELERMHAMLSRETGVDGIECCTETRETPGNRLKPSPAMLRDAAARDGIDLRASWMVGDRAGDIEAGRAAGCRTVFVDLGYAAEPAPEGQEATVASLADAVDVILAVPMEKADALSR